MLFSNRLKRRVEEDPFFIHKLYHRILESDDGKYLLLDMIDKSSLFEFAATDREETFNSGKRAWLQNFLQILQLDIGDLAVEVQQDPIDLLDRILGDKDGE